MPKETEGIGGIAARLFKARKLLSAERGHAVTQAHIGAAVGVTEGQIGHWEKGRQVPDLPMIDKLAAALVVSPVWLSYGVGPMEPSGPTSGTLTEEERLAAIARSTARRAAHGLPSVADEEAAKKQKLGDGARVVGGGRRRPKPPTDGQ